MAASIVERASINDASEIWSAWGGRARFSFAPMVLADMGLEITVAARIIRGSRTYAIAPVLMPIANLGSLAFHAPSGSFAGFIDGRLTIRESMQLELADNSPVSWQSMVIRPRRSERFPELEILDGNDNLLFLASSIHVYIDRDSNRLAMERMDLKLSPDLAARLGEPRFAGNVIGELALEAELNIPESAGQRPMAAISGDACADRPYWTTDGFEADIGLIDIQEVVDRGTLDGNNEILTPSTALKNLQGLDGADIPWFAKFTGPAPPHDNDQHPYLIWNLYRIDADGRLLQIGRSGLKHAFFAANTPGCIAPTPCEVDFAGVVQDKNHVFWPGCEDVYGVGNNDNPPDIGPRVEVNPLTGDFDSKGSFFDQDDDGEQDNGSDDPGENRLVVPAADLETPAAEFFFESWYIVRDDVDIFNSMGFLPITPEKISAGSWRYASDPGAFTQGPVIDHWVPPATDPQSDRQNVGYYDPGIGRFRLAVRTISLGGGRYRYDYMLANFDVVAGISALEFPGVLASPDSVEFRDVDPDANNDWAVSNAIPLRFEAPPDAGLPWGNGYSFRFTAGPPRQGEAQVSAVDAGGNVRRESIAILTSMPERLLVDGFE